MARSSSPSASPKRPLRKDAARNRERILDAAQEVFAQRGLSAGLNEIAHHAGVGVGTVYRHFPDREQLIDGLFEQRIGEISHALETAAADEDPWRGLTGFLERALELQARDRGLQQLVLGAPGAFERVSRVRARLRPIGERLIERARGAGALRADFEPEDFPLLQLMLGSVIDLSHDVAPELWRRYLAIVLDGLRAEPLRPEPLPVPAPPFEDVDRMMVEGWGRGVRR
jgi:AcrR family transcriptional regulator